MRLQITEINKICKESWPPHQLLYHWESVLVSSLFSRGYNLTKFSLGFLPLSLIFNLSTFSHFIYIYIMHRHWPYSIYQFSVWFYKTKLKGFCFFLGTWAFIASYAIYLIYMPGATKLYDSFKRFFVPWSYNSWSYDSKTVSWQCPRDRKCHVKL